MSKVFTLFSVLAGLDADALVARALSIDARGIIETLGAVYGAETVMKELLE
jgi:hypothetical protein